MRFTEVTNWTDPDSGEVVLANRHSLKASTLQQDAVETVLIDDRGEVVASWPTRIVERVAWIAPPESDVHKPSASTGTGSKVWLEQIKRVHPNAYQPWTEAEDAQLREEHASGLSPVQIGELHQRRTSAIESRLRKLGITTS